jgi:hypothetical protein
MERHHHQPKYTKDDFQHNRPRTFIKKERVLSTQDVL